MADQRVASRYVKSLLGLAVEQNALESVHQDMKMFDELCDKNRDFLVMLRSPIIKHERKRDILGKIFKGKVHPLTWAILDIITRKNREPLLPAIANDFHRAYNEYQGVGLASVTTAFAIDQSIRSEIEAIAIKLSSLQKTELVEKVDPSLIGGFILNVGDQRIDTSISGKLKSMRLKFSYNPYKREF